MALFKRTYIIFRDNSTLVSDREKQRKIFRCCFDVRRSLDIDSAR